MALNIATKNTGDNLTATEVNEIVSEVNLKAETNEITVTSVTGWADYVDTQYTSGSPLSLAANTATNIPNNAGTVRNSEKPLDITGEFYESGLITGRDGDAYLLTVEYKAVPTAAGTTYIDTWVDIGGAVGELYRRPATFPKGQGVERNISFSTGIYTLNTWQANGGTLKFSANGTADIYDIRYIIYRLHKAGNSYAQNNSISSDQLAAIIAASGATESNPFVVQSAINNVIKSDTTQAGGGTAIQNHVFITQAAYDALGTKDANTLYEIV